MIENDKGNDTGIRTAHEEDMFITKSKEDV